MTLGLTASQVAALAAGYRAYVQALSTVPLSTWSEGTLPDRTAYDVVHDSLYRGPAALALAFIVEILRQGSEQDIPAVTHLLVECLVKHQGCAIVEGLEEEALRNERLRRCLGGVMIMAGELPAEILARLVRASDGILKVHPAGSWTYLRAAT
jgi:hypothetical protein